MYIYSISAVCMCIIKMCVCVCVTNAIIRECSCLKRERITYGILTLIVYFLHRCLHTEEIISLDRSRASWKLFFTLQMNDQKDTLYDNLLYRLGVLIFVHTCRLSLSVLLAVRYQAASCLGYARTLTLFCCTNLKMTELWSHGGLSYSIAGRRPNTAHLPVSE